MSNTINEISLEKIFKLATEIIEAATAKGMTIGTAESCTGGLIAAALTSISGSSACFHGGIIAYDNRIKSKLLAVPPTALDKYGAVSEIIAKRMAAGALDRLNVDLTVSVTGIAGPGGGSADKPVGTVWIGTATRQDGKAVATATLHNFDETKSRNKIRDAACYAALLEVKRALG